MYSKTSLPNRRKSIILRVLFGGSGKLGCSCYGLWGSSSFSAVYWLLGCFFIFLNTSPSAPAVSVCLQHSRCFITVLCCQRLLLCSEILSRVGQGFVLMVGYTPLRQSWICCYQISSILSCCQGLCLSVFSHFIPLWGCESAALPNHSTEYFSQDEVTEVRLMPENQDLEKPILQHRCICEFGAK